MGVSSNGSQLPSSKNSSSTARTAEEASHNARILIVSASEEESSGYVSLMNCIFSAQKAVSHLYSCEKGELLGRKRRAES